MNKKVAAVGVVLVSAVALVFVYQVRANRLTPGQRQAEAEARQRLKQVEQAAKAAESAKKPAESTSEAAGKSAESKGNEGQPAAPKKAAAEESKMTFKELSAAPTDEQAGIPKVLTVKFECSNGDFFVEFNSDWAPRGVKRIYELVKEGFFNEARFFRCAKGFVVQWGIAGDPSVMAKWRGANIKDDPPKQSNVRGTITFAATGAPNTRSTQIFVNLADNSRLDSKGFAPVGKVIQGMDVFDRLNFEYGERPNQDQLRERGNAYLKEQFPNLDYIKRAIFVEKAS